MTAIATAVKKLSGVDGMQKVGYIVGTVIEVNEDERTCDVSTISNAGEQTLSGVNLMAEVDDGELLIPAIGSTVIVTSSEKVDNFVVMFSELQKRVTIVGDSGFEMEPDLITFNGGDYGGLVKVIELTQKYNDLVGLVNRFIAHYNLHTHPSNGAITPTQQTETAQTITRSDIESTTIKHGSSI